MCLHPDVFMREGRPASRVVVGEGEEPPRWAAAAERPALIKGLERSGGRGWGCGQVGVGGGGGAAGYPQERSSAVRSRMVSLSSRCDPPP